MSSNSNSDLYKLKWTIVRYLNNLIERDHEVLFPTFWLGFEGKTKQEMLSTVIEKYVTTTLKLFDDYDSNVSGISFSYPVEQKKQFNIYFEKNKDVLEYRLCYVVDSKSYDLVEMEMVGTEITAYSSKHIDDFENQLASLIPEEDLLNFNKFYDDRIEILSSLPEQSSE